MGLGLGVLGRRRGVVGGAREAPVVVRAADRRRAEGDREVRDAPVVVRVPVVVAEMFVVVGPTKGRVGPGRPTALERWRVRRRHTRHAGQSCSLV